MRNAGRGAAAARNTGARAASGGLLLFLDDDMRVEPEHLIRHVETHERFPGSMLGGDWWYTPRALRVYESTPFGRYRLALERGYVPGRGEGGQTGVSEVSTLASFDLSLSRTDFWRVGGFDESFPYAGAEDQDLSARAARAGLRLLRHHGIRLLHDDRHATLRQFALRQQRGAHTVLALVRNFPQFHGQFYRNERLSRRDSPALVARKCAKSLLSAPPALATLHGLAGALERVGAPDRLLWPLYRLILGLHIFRGYRQALASEARSRTQRAGR
jgi:GT2 family glycosyltransferase